MASITIQNQVQRTPGSYAFGPVAIPNGLTLVKMAVDLTQFAALDAHANAFTLSFTLAVNGVDVESREFGRVGGETINGKTGLPDTESSWTFALPVGVSRTIRGVLNVQQTMTTTVTATVT